MPIIDLLPNSDAKIIKYFSDAVGLFEPGTVSLKGLRFHDFNLYVYGLSNVVKRIGPYTFDPLKQSFIRTAISTIARNGQSITIENVERALEDAYYSYLNAPRKKYCCISYINIDKRSFPKRTINIEPNKIRIANYEKVNSYFNKPLPPKKFDINKAHKDLTELAFYEEFKKNCSVYSTFLMADVYGINEFDAGYSFGKIVDDFLAILNFAFQSGKISYVFGKPPEPVNFISPPNVFFIFSDSMEPLEDMKSSVITNGPCINLKNINRPNLIKDADNLIRQLNRKEPELRSHLLQCLQTYSDSLACYDTPFISSFKMWQVMELLSLKEYENNKYNSVKGFRLVSLKVVCDRILSLLKVQPPCLEEDILLHFKDRRNLGVHENYSLSHSETDFNMVKDIVDFALDEVISSKMASMDGLLLYYKK